MHMCKFFIFALFTLAFIALVKLCNDVASPFLYFLFSHLCFLAVKSHQETSGVFFLFFWGGHHSSFLLLLSITYKTTYHSINVESGTNLLCGVTKVLHLGQSIFLPSESWSGVKDR